MSLFVQNVGNGDKIVWDLNDPKDAAELGIVMGTFVVIGFIALIGFGIYALIS